jgi:protein SCO1/2
MFTSTSRLFSFVLASTYFGLLGSGFASVDNNAKTTQESSPITDTGANLDEKLGQVAALDVVLRNENGESVQLRSLVDRPTILTLNYFRCGGICSPILNGLAKAINHSSIIPGTDFRVITVSFDERDTPEIASRKQSNYVKEVERSITVKDWRFLTGDKDATRRLADSVGFYYKRIGDDFAHPGAIMFLSPAGKITRYMYGSTYLPADLEMAVREAARGEVQPTINKWLKYCFTYDPVGRKYALATTRVAGSFVLISALGFAAFLFLSNKTKRSTTNSEKL